MRLKRDAMMKCLPTYTGRKEENLTYEIETISPMRLKRSIHPFPHPLVVRRKEENLTYEIETKKSIMENVPK